MEGEIFPDTRRAVISLINSTDHLGVPVLAVKHLNTDPKGTLVGPFPVAQVLSAPGGKEGYVDRVDKISIQVYAEGEAAERTLEAITAFITGDGIETEYGYLDSIETDEVPTEYEYPSETLNKATATYFVTVRPI